MTIESYLTRELNLRFIDARNIATEARLNLQIHHYPNQEEEQAIRQEACRIFNCRPEGQRYAMQRMSADLQSLKNSCGSDHSSNMDSSISGSSCEFSTSDRSFAVRSNRKWSLGHR